MRKVNSIRELQMIELNMLKYLDNFCRENQITYFLSGGTMLGAIRHNGFIPWDDDVDINMLREEYDKFSELVSKGIFENERYKALLPGEKNYAYPFIKIVDKETLLLESDFKKKYKLGIYIDIFPMEYMKEDYKERAQLHYECGLLRTKYCIAANTWTRVKKDHPRLKILQFVRWLLYGLIGPQKFSLELAQKFVCKEPTSLVGDLVHSAGLDRDCFHTESYGDFVLHQFEDGMYPIPKGWEEYLTNMYGDYMKLPPEEERRTHAIDAWIID